MTSLELLLQGSRDEPGFQFDKQTKERLVLIQTVRVGFLLAILFMTLAFQALQSEFLNPDVWVPIYSLLALSFLVNGFFVFFFDTIRNYWLANAFLFAYDALFITFLVRFSGISQSIFIFLYLVNIILCGLVFKRRGGLLLALWTSTLFSVLMIFLPDERAPNLVFSIGLNNLAFFSVAVLAGFLSEQLDFMGSQLTERGKEIGVLRDANRLIVDNIGTGLLTVDGGGLIAHANPSAQEILDAGELTGKTVEQLFPGVQARIDEWRSTSGQKSFRFDMSVGLERERIFQFTASRLNADTELKNDVILMFEDLTEVKRLEYAIRQQEKLAAVGQLAAGIAHEIRNPLASISGSIQLLETTSASDDDQKLMRIVLKEIDRLNNLISEFLEYVRPDSPKEDPIYINQLLEEVLDMVKHHQGLPQNVVQHRTLKSQKVVLGNFDKLKQAFLNIVINAYQAMQMSTSADLFVDTWDEGESIFVAIKDTGGGIEEAQLKKIFEPFHTTKIKGTGLGLAVTHSILENHQARVFVESKPGAGTTFTIEFPGASDHAGEKRQSA